MSWPTLRSNACIALLCTGGAAIAQPSSIPSADYPSRSIRLILPFPPGGGTDTLGRILAQRLNEVLGQSVVPENRPGAGGNIGNELVTKALPDGYTLLLGSPSLAISPSLYRKLNYDPAKDLTPIAMTAEIPSMFTVHRNVPVRSLRDLIQLARAQPGKLAFGTGGAGTSNDLGAHLFLSTTRLKILIVPHKGVNQATLGLLGGHVDMVIAGLATVAPHIRDGKLRGLALLGPSRSATLPDVATAEQAGYGWLQVRSWYVVMAPAGTPQGIVDKLNVSISRIVQSPETKARMLKLGFEALTGSPEEAARFIAAETDRWGKVVHAAGVRVE
jgi:tripartite-type tricarboxylate transporter receptor subunit TctC